MSESIDYIILCIVGGNMALIGIFAIIEMIVTLAKKKRAITHSLSILYIIGGPSFILFGFFLVKKYIILLNQM